MTTDEKPPGDDATIRCPRLGHQIHFSYCRTENRGLPCFKTLDCWHHHFKVVDHLKDELTEDQWQSVFGSPTQPKVLSLIELIERAKKTKPKEDS